ncbi:scarecrow-like protein 9 [Dorcoceras hygrometricum]|uniref:Scarecrow-like protein 9 n=1 Tax=Dorcoceras hygrometricum TaxID=472368 RepID=A0A2Z7DGK6_9LAMI|nr:scarecrow-like protein 9 [Dorcoceras hygrometricum]
MLHRAPSHGAQPQTSAQRFAHGAAGQCLGIARSNKQSGGQRLAVMRDQRGRDVRPARISCATSGAHRTTLAQNSSNFGRPLRYPCGNLESSTCVILNGSGIQLAIGITDSACKNQLVVVSVQYGPFNPYIPIRSTTIGKSRVAKDPIAMHTSWRSNNDLANSIGYPRMSASGESSTTMHRLLHASGSHPISPPNDPKTNQYNQDLGLIHSTNGNRLESPNEGSSIDHEVTIYLHAQNITMFPTNETWYFVRSTNGALLLVAGSAPGGNPWVWGPSDKDAIYTIELKTRIINSSGNRIRYGDIVASEYSMFASQILVSSSGGLILIFTAQSTRK